MSDVRMQQKKRTFSIKYAKRLYRQNSYLFESRNPVLILFMMDTPGSSLTNWAESAFVKI